MSRDACEGVSRDTHECPRGDSLHRRTSAGASRETEVVGLIARGHTDAEIARLLWLSLWTVGDHLESVFEKTGVRSRGEPTSRLFFDHYLPRLGG
ncbi:response regulator transcription factor [Blastococcus colisei]|uniref:response regulator transcription factor n=1 Tax=Blastococcus colisei TaxID=1564162 RepID=UPI001150FF86|nr:helix-turn-helix transcriptional regulator [Blastococcus colisei]